MWHLFYHHNFPNVIDNHVAHIIGLSIDDVGSIQVNCVHSSLFLFSFGSSLRNVLVRMVNSFWFTSLILVAIILNSIFLALQDPGLSSARWLQSFLGIADYVFLGLFAVEMVVKIVAYGFIAHSKSYLRVSWNILDCVVVLTGFVALANGIGSGVSALRVFRVLRPLRTVARVRSLRHILTRLMNSMPRMVDVFVLLMFVAWVLDIFGVQLFMGTLHQRCYAEVGDSSNGTRYALILNDTAVCSQSFAGHFCSESSNGVVLPQTCRVDTGAYDRQVLNFDNLFTGFMLTFKIICRDNWPDDFRDLGNAYGEVVFIYFFFATLFAGYFCVNLFIAVLSSAFSKKDSDEVVPPLKGSVSLATVLGATAIGDSMALICLLKPHSHDDGIDFREAPEIIDPFAVEEEETPPESLVRKKQIGPIGRFFRRSGYRPVRRFVCGRPFNIALMILISLNAIVLSFDRLDAPPALESVINISSFVFNIMFLIDAALKLVGLGPSYFRTASNVFDFALCMTSIPDLVAGTSSPYSSLRAFRLVRLLRVARTWKNLQSLLRLVIISLRSVASLSLVALIIIFIYTILGFQLFDAPLADVRFSFTNVFDSFLTVFVIVTGENWAQIMAAVINVDGFWAVLYFISLVFFGNFILTNLFIAIILENFGGDAHGRVDDDDEVEHDFLAHETAAIMAERAARPREVEYHREVIMPVADEGDAWSDGDDGADNGSFHSATEDCSPAAVALRLQRELNTRSGTGAIFHEFATSTANDPTGDHRDQACVGAHVVGDCTVLSLKAEQEIMQLEREQTRRNAEHRARVLASSTIRKLLGSSNVRPKVKNPLAGGLLALQKSDVRKGRKMTLAERAAADLQWHGLKEKAWLCLDPDNCLREKVGRVLKHPVTEYFLVLVTIASSVFLALDNPRLAQTNPGLAAAMNEIDIAFITVFGIEMISKLFALGVFSHKGAYFRSVWNAIDFIVFVTSLLALFNNSFKIGRALRVLRLTNLSFSLRVILTALFSAIPGMGSVFVLCGLLWWIYAVLGVALFKGALYHCSDPSIFAKENCTGTFVQQQQLAFDVANVTMMRRWEPIRESSTFDGIETSLYSLLKLSLSDGWFDIMYMGIDSTSTTTGPRLNNAPHLSLYFVTFMLFGNFFAVNLFVGVLVDRFVKHKKRGEGYSLMTDVQQQWVLAQKVLLRSRIPVTPQCPRNIIRKVCFVISQNPFFDWFFFTLIVLSSILLSMYYYGMPRAFRDALDWTGTAIIVLFTVEMIVKVLALNPKVYWRDAWNRVDITIVVLSWVAFGIGNGTSVVHVFRVARLFLLMRKLKGLQTLFITLFQALPELCNVGIVLTVLYFIFAVVGVEVFGRAEKIAPLSHLLNFDDVGHALMLLYTVTTTEGWGEVTDALRNGRGGGWYAYPFMIIFMILMSWIMMNLLVTVVIDNFSEAEIVEGQDAAFRILDLFRQKWIVHDTTAKQRLNVNVVLKILPTMPNSIWDRSMMAARSRKRQTPWVCMLRQLEKLHIPIDSHDNVLYDDCIASLALRLFSITVEEAIIVSQRTVYGVTWSTNRFSVHHYFAAKLLTKRVRNYIATRRERLLESQLRDLRDQHAIFVEHEVMPLRRSHQEMAQITHWLADKLAEERQKHGEVLVDPPPLPPPRARREARRRATAVAAAAGGGGGRGHFTTDPFGSSATGETTVGSPGSPGRRRELAHGGREVLHVLVCSDDSSAFSSSSEDDS